MRWYSDEWLDPFLPVRGQDRLRAVCAFGLFATFMASYYVFKPARESLSLHVMGWQKLPHVWLASVFVAVAVSIIYNRAFVHVSVARLLPGTVYTLIGCALVFWLADAVGFIPPLPLAVTFFLWVAIYGTLVAALFWSLANDIFDLETGRKVYGFVGLGGLVGGVVGSWITTRLLQAEWLITEQLLPIGALVLATTIPMIKWLYRSSQEKTRGSSTGKPDEVKRHKEGWRAIMKEPYVTGMAILVTLITFTATSLALQYNRIVDETLAGKEMKTMFFADLYQTMNLAALGIQLFVTGPLHRRWGPIPGLYPLPLIAGLGVATLVISPTLAAIMVIWAVGMALQYSLNQASKELLYVPTSIDVKYGAKAYIDIFFYRVGDGLASAVMLLGAGTTGAASARDLLLVCGVAVLLWFGNVYFLAKGYRRRTTAVATKQAVVADPSPAGS